MRVYAYVDNLVHKKTDGLKFLSICNKDCFIIKPNRIKVSTVILRE